MRVLGIETTCDETAVAVIGERRDGEGGDILSNEVMSQIARHAAYGGVVPEIAARAHLDVLDRLIIRALENAKVELKDLDAIAACAGPGLIGGVLVGLTAGKALALALGKPFIAINHLEAHALTARLVERLTFPYLALLVSGGHTQIVAVEGVNRYRRLGSTVDDAAGEAFDKVAKMLGLGYPGGPQIEQRAQKGDHRRFDFPRPMLGRPTPDFSLSGLKTAVRLEIQKIVAASGALAEQDVNDLAASFQAAVVDVIVDRVRAAVRVFSENGRPSPNGLVIGGGVGANGAIREALSDFCTQAGLRLVLPEASLCADNGAMVAWAGLERFRLGLADDFAFAPRPRWPLDASAGPNHHGKA